MTLISFPEGGRTFSTPQGPSEEDLVRMGLYLEDLRNSSEIVERHYLGSDDTPEGSIHRFGLITAAGYAYNGNVSVPDKITNDIPVLHTAAWGTSTRGLNEHTDRAFMEDGLAAIHIGNEGSYHPTKLPRANRSMSLALTASVALRFSSDIAPQFKYSLHPSKRTAVGESKGGMEGMGLISFDDFFEQEVLMADFTAACIPRKPRLGDLFEMRTQIVSEPLSTAKLAGRLAFGLALHFPATIDPHPHAVSSQIKKGRAVFSGEAGDLGRLVPKDKILHHSVFSSDFASMYRVWEEIFADNPNARTTKLKGSHLTLADPETLAYVRARQRAFRELYAAAGNRLKDDYGNQLVTGNAVFELAHQYVAEYLPELPNGMVQKAVRFIFKANKSIVPFLPNAA